MGFPHTRRALLLAGLTATVTTAAPPAGAAEPTRDNPERVNLSSTERQSRGAAPRFLTMSAHGRHVAFDSPAADLVRGDTNGKQDVFVRDRTSGTTSRVSVSNTGRQANRGSSEAAISGSGRYVVFTSGASNLVRGHTNQASDVFVRDRQRKTTIRVSVGARGAQAKGASYAPSISANGRFVVFASEASNLVAGDSNRVSDAFVRDLHTGLTRVLSIARGEEGNGPSGPDYAPQVAVSDDGHHAAFVSEASTSPPPTTMTPRTSSPGTNRENADTGPSPNHFDGRRT